MNPAAKAHLSVVLLALAGLLQLAAVTYSVALRRLLEVKATIFAAGSIGAPIRVGVSQYIAVALLSVSFAWIAILVLREGDSKVAMLNSVASAALVALSVGVGVVTAQTFDAVNGMLTGLSFVLALASAPLVRSVPRSQTFRPFQLSTLQITTTAVFSGLTAVLTSVLQVPSPTGGFTHIGDTAIFIAALLFGSRVGALSGVIGAVAADLYTGYDRWFISIPAHGLEGFIAGFGKGRSLAVQIALLVVAGFVMASTYFYMNVFLRGVPLALISYARDLFGQAGISLVVGLIITRSVQRIMPGLVPPLKKS